MAQRINILIVEDDRVVAQDLENTLKSEGYQIAGAVDNGIEAFEKVKKNEVDLVLLDIQIKGEWDGIETAKRLTTVKRIPFIYLAAFSDDETLQRAKETSPAAYLVEPYRQKNLLIAIDLALHNFAIHKVNLAREASLNRSNPSDSADQNESILYFNDAVFVKQNYKFIKIRLQDIYFLEAEGNYTCIITKEGKCVLRNTLNTVLAKLNFMHLIRVHRSYAINMQHVDTFNESSVYISGRDIPLSRHYKEDFLRHFDFL